MQFIFDNSVICHILREVHSLNWYKFLMSALSSLLNGTLHCQYFVTALKIIIYNNIFCFYLRSYEHGKRIQNWTYFDFSMKISRKWFRNVCTYLFYMIIVIFEKCISRGSVATRLRCGRHLLIVYYQFFTGCGVERKFKLDQYLAKAWVGRWRSGTFTVVCWQFRLQGVDVDLLKYLTL